MNYAKATPSGFKVPYGHAVMWSCTCKIGDKEWKVNVSGKTPHEAWKAHPREFRCAAYSNCSNWETDGAKVSES